MEEKFSSYTIDENERFVPESKNKVLSKHRTSKTLILLRGINIEKGDLYFLKFIL